MENLKFALFSIFVLAILGLLGYWAVVTMTSGDEHVSAAKIEKLENENEELRKEIEKLGDKLALLEPRVETPEEPKTETPKPAPTTVSQHQVLINELQKLIDDKVVIKLKSRGTRVGTVQKFLNLYFETSNKVDNDFGASTQKALIEFQKEQGLSGDGEAGKTTFEKMIEWLKKG